jgi:hypothetical protein
MLGSVHNIYKASIAIAGVALAASDGRLRSEDGRAEVAVPAGLARISHQKNSESCTIWRKINGTTKFHAVSQQLSL